MKNLFVGNLSFQTTESEIRSIFEEFGEILRLQIITDRETGQSRGFGFVEMADEAEAMNAIQALNGREIGGRVWNVSEARPKPDRVSGRESRAVYRESYRGR